MTAKTSRNKNSVVKRKELWGRGLNKFILFKNAIPYMTLTFTG